MVRPEQVQPAAVPAPDVGAVLTGLSRENTIYRKAIDVCDRLADAALRGVDAAELTAVLAELVGKEVALLDPAFGLRASAGGAEDSAGLRWERSDPSVDRLLRALEAERRPLRVPSIPGTQLWRGCLVAPVAVGTSTLGYLLVLDAADGPEQIDDVDLLTATYAATLFALTLAHERTSNELGLRYRQAIVDALVSGHFLDAADARTKARSLGLADGTAYRVAVLRGGESGAGTDGDSGRAPGRVLDRLAAVAPTSVAAVRDGTVVVLLRAETDRSGAATHLKRAGALAEEWRRGTGTYPTCGLSEQLTHPEQAPHGFRQAEQAIDLGLRLGRAGQPVCYDDLGIYRLLLRIGDMSQLRGFADDVLGALVSYDAAHRLDLIGTLSVYLRHRGSLKQVARTMHLHANTVAYRVQRLEQLTGLDLGDPDDLLVAHVAIKIIESNTPAERPGAVPR